MGELASAYTTFLNNKLNPNGDKNYAIYDYAADFDKFWPAVLSSTNGSDQLPQVALDAGKANHTALIIIWDSLPPDDGPAKLGPHLTPLDWALAFSTRVLNKHKMNGVASFSFSIHIVDLTSTQFENTFAMQMAASICEALPWVKLYAPLPRGRRAYEVKFPIEDLQKGIWPKAEIELSTKLSGGKVADRLAKLNQAWRAWVVQSNDHHDLNNMIGPQVITEILAGKPVSVCVKNDFVRTMLTRLDWTGLLNRDKITKKWGKLPLNQPANVIVIDDQLEWGWDRVVCSLMGINSPPQKASCELKCIGSNTQIKLFGATSPEYLLQQLFDIENDGDEEDVVFNPENYKTRKSVTPLIPNSDNLPTAIILDLYLFAGKSLDEVEEWYKIVGTAAKLVAELDEKQLAWPGFTEKNQIDELAETGVTNEANLDTALSLLPRLCALRWPSVPIILFSATERRGLISSLADYGNIFLSNPKPNVLAGNTGEHIAAFVENWQLVLLASQGLLNVQKELMDLQDIPHKYATSNLLPNDKHTHIVIAFDETGDFTKNNKSAVGGVMLFTQGNSEKEAINNSFDMQELFRARGINFFSRAPYYTDANYPGLAFDATKKKKDYVCTELSSAMSGCHENNHARLAAFCLWINKGDYTLNETEYIDGSYFRGLTTCIELIACELLADVTYAEIGDEKKAFTTTLSWWFPTKVTRYDSIAKAAKAARKFDVWQVGRYEKRNFIPSSRTQSIGGDGNAYSVLVQSLANRQVLDLILKATQSLKARKIPYDKVPDHSNPGKFKTELNIHWLCNCGAAPFLKPGIPLHQTIKCEIQTGGAICQKELYADYSVMAHLADAVLSPHKFPSDEVGQTAFSPELCFEVEEGKNLHDFIHVSRLIDDGRLADAFKLAYRHSFFLNAKGKGIMKNPSSSFARAPLAKRVQNELRKHVLSLSGNDLIELAGLPLRYSSRP